MMSAARILFLTCLACALAAPAGTAVRTPEREPSAAARTPAPAVPRPLLFAENRGQTDPRAAFVLRGRGLTVFFEESGITYAVGAPGARWAVKADFPGARRVRPEGARPAATVQSFFTGPRERWVSGARTYREIRYRDLWPGIDLVASAENHALKYAFEVAAGADPGLIRTEYRGATALALDPDGGLRIRTPRGDVEDAAPVAFEEGGRMVAAAFRLQGTTCGFSLGARDPSRPLVIDPGILVWSGFFGGDSEDVIEDVAVDGEGAVYIAGHTSSDDLTFPVVEGPDLVANGNIDAFVAKVSPDGLDILYAGFFGGSGLDQAFAVAVDGGGNVYFAGSTFSTASTFPVATGPDYSYNLGGDAFVAKLDTTGTAVLYSGYLGGTGQDTALGLAVDASGAAYVVGSTLSNEASFPDLTGPDLFYGGSQDGFVARVAADGTAFDFVGYVGGDGEDAVEDVALASGKAFLVGTTKSSEATFPVAVGPSLAHSGDSDAFVARVAADGSGFEYAGFIGGAGADAGLSIAVDSEGSAYVTGHAGTPLDAFPVAVGPDTTANGGTEAFVAKVPATGAGLTWCGFIGGTGADHGTGIVVDAEGRAGVAGYTTSTESSFPVEAGPELTAGGGRDAFVAWVDADGAGLSACGFLGGTSDDTAWSLALTPDGSALVAGATTSAEGAIGFPVAGGPDLTWNGGSDGFLTRLTGPGTPLLAVTKGSLKDTATPGKDSLSASGLLLSPMPAGFDPMATPVQIRAGAKGAEFLLNIPAADAGWKVKGAKYSWKGAGGSLQVDNVKRTLKLKLARITFGAPQANPIRVEVRFGTQDYGAEAAWTENPKKPGLFKFP